MNNTRVYPATLSTNLRATGYKNPVMRVVRVLIRGEHAILRVGHVLRHVKRAFTHVRHVARRVKHAFTHFTRVARHVERIEDLWTNPITRLVSCRPWRIILLRSRITHYTCYPWEILPTTRRKGWKA